MRGEEKDPNPLHLVPLEDWCFDSEEQIQYFEKYFCVQAERPDRPDTMQFVPKRKVPNVYVTKCMSCLCVVCEHWCSCVCRGVPPDKLFA